MIEDTDTLGVEGLSDEFQRLVAAITSGDVVAGQTSGNLNITIRAFSLSVETKVSRTEVANWASGTVQTMWDINFARTTFPVNNIKMITIVTLTLVCCGVEEVVVGSITRGANCVLIAGVTAWRESGTINTLTVHGIEEVSCLALSTDHSSRKTV